MTEERSKQIINYEWHKQPKTFPIQPIGKLKRVSFPAVMNKLYVDEINNSFIIDFRTGKKYYMCSYFKQDGFGFNIKYNPIYK